MKGKLLRVYAVAILTIVVLNYYMQSQWFELHKTPNTLNIQTNANIIQPNESGIYTRCLEEVFLNLPLGPGRPILKKKLKIPPGILSTFAHHYDAGNRHKWNHKRTFDKIDNISNNSSCSIWEIGAHTSAVQSQQFLDMYGHCKYHAYEPIPMYHDELTKKWSNDDRMTTHNYGIGKGNSTFHVPKKGLQDQSTFLADFTETEGDVGGADQMITATVRSFEYAIQEAGKKPSLIHMNCEGCEWSLVPEAIESGFFEGIDVIQIGFHNYGKVGLGQRALEYCEIRRGLSRTHNLDFVVPFAWEQWRLK